MADDDRLLTIGQFARASGLTAKALRHYDSVGLLRPAVVDPDSGYRLYLASQADLAALIKCLRDLELPVAEVRKLLDLHGTDTAAMTGALAEHRRLLQARVARLQRQLHDLDHVIAEKGWHPMKRPKEENVLDDQVRRELAATLFNRVWTLLEQDKRTEAEDAEMIHAAHASCYHWMKFAAGEPFRRARGEWQISHVYAVLGRAEPAQFHARNTLEICEREGLGDFDHGFAYEALARAAAVAGEGDEARRWVELARGAATQVSDEGDRELLLSDLETIPAT